MSAARRASLAMFLAAVLVPAASGASAQAADAGRADDDAGTPAEARRLVEERSDAGYARREAITKRLTEMDDRAVAALVVAKRSRSAPMRAWAADTLESMGRERADEQIRTRSDELLAGIFAAYGEARDPDALGVLSSFVGSDRAKLRDAARSALLAYGGDAISKLRQDYAELTGEAPSPAWSAAEVARDLFAASDRIRLRDVYSLLDAGMTRANAGDLAGAAADFDAVLARQDGVGAEGTMAQTFAAYGESVEDSDPAAARAYLGKAERLLTGTDAQAAVEPSVQAQLAVLDGRGLEARGIPGEASYRSALALDPTNARARIALDRLEAGGRARHTRLRRWVLATGGAVLAFLMLVLFVGRHRRTRPRALTPGRSSRRAP